MLAAFLAVWGTLFHGGGVRAAEHTVTVGVWIWEGTVNDSWFESGNWRAGDLLQAPTPNLPVSFGPTQLILNGIATDTYFMPKRGAVLSADFRSPRLTMRNFDGICELTVRNGATYTVDLATVGKDTLGAYVPAGPVVPPRLRLVDAHLAGKWVIGGDAPAILDVEGSASVGNLVLAESVGSSVVVNLHPGASLEQRSGMVAIGSGTVFVENHGDFIQRGAWSGTVAGWTNRSGSSLRLRSMGFRSRIENRGLMTFAEGSGEKHMQFAGRVTLTGGGEVRLLDDGNSRLTRVGTDGVLVNVDNVIRGGRNGRIGVEVVNEHVLRVEEGSLYLDAPVDNRAGVVEVGAGGRLEMKSSTLSGRVLMTAGGVLNQGVLRGTRIEGVLTVGGGGLALREAITNLGVITFGGQLEGEGVLRVEGAVPLRGGGDLILGGRTRLLSSGEGAVLVNVDNVIRGGRSARIGVEMVNEHVLRVEEGSLYLDAPVDNRAGVVEVGAGGRLEMGSRTLSGRVLVTSGGVLHQGVLSATRIEGVLTVGGGGLALREAITNLGVITFGGRLEGEGVLRVEGVVPLRGGGDLILVDRTRLLSSGEGAALVNVDNVIRGGRNGRIGVEVVNEHVLRVEEGSLYLDAPVDNRAGVVEVGAGGRLEMGSSTLSGGSLVVNSGGVVSGGVLENCTTSGALTVGGGGLTWRGALTNRGSITAAQRAGPIGFWVDGTVVLEGGGEVLLSDVNSGIYRVGAGAGVELVNRDHVLRGGHGAIVDVPISNGGTILAEAGRLRLARLVKSLDGARYGALGGAVLEIGAGAGGLDLPEQSLLFGDGTLQSGIRTLGVIAPGASIGTLSITGDLTLGGSLRCEVAGAASDRLVVGGKLVLENAVLEVKVGPDGASLPAYVLVGYQALQGGRFAKVEGLPRGYVLDYAYQGRQIALVRSVRTRFQEWAAANGLGEGEAGLGDDPNGDGLTNLEHFAFGSDPKGVGGRGKGPAVELVSEGGNQYLTLTLPVLEEAGFSATPVPRASIHGVQYSIFGGDRLGVEGLAVGVEAVDGPAMEILPDHDGDGRPDWRYRRFRLNRPVALGTTGFLWVEVSAE